MKIGQFSDSFLPIVDGVGRVVYEYSDKLARQGNEVSVICPMNDMGNRGLYPFEIIDYYSQQLLINKQYDIGLTIDPHYRKLLDMKEFDIIHIHSPFIAGVEGLIYAKSHKIPIVATFHSKYYDDFYQATKSKILAKIGVDGLVDFYNRCDEVWTVSNYAAKVLASYGYEKEIFVIENGLNFKNVNQALIDKAIQTFNIDTSKPTLLYVGQMNWKKNILLILEACDLLKRSHIDYNLLLVGQGPHEKEIRKECEDLNISDKVIFTGLISEQDLLDGVYMLADIFVFPSNYDTYSMVVREAANVETPSIVLSGSAPAEPIKNNENGFICENNSFSLYEILKNNIKDRDKLKLIGKNAKNTIPVSWDEVIERVKNRYEMLINR